MNEEYSIDQWEKDIENNRFCGKHPNWFHSGCNLECPRCHSFGFYGPKESFDSKGKRDRKYRACKFCGFWQDIWGNVFNERGSEPYRCIHVCCGKCGIYDWKVPWAEELGKCEKCGDPFQKIKWAVDDPKHTFLKNKEIMDQLHNQG